MSVCVSVFGCVSECPDGSGLCGHIFQRCVRELKVMDDLLEYLTYIF